MAGTDIVVGRKGDSLSGTVQDKQFSIQTVMGLLTFPKKHVAWIHFVNPPHFSVDEIWLHSGDRVSGKIRGSSLKFKPDSGETMSIPFASIHTVIVSGGFSSTAAALEP